MALRHVPPIGATDARSHLRGLPSPAALAWRGLRLMLRMCAVVAGGSVVMMLAAALLALAGAFPSHALAAEPRSSSAAERRSSSAAEPRAANSAQAAATMRTDPEVAAAAAALRGLTTMRADFVQTDADGQRVGGVLTLKRGGLIRFEYAPGYPMLIVADGKALTVVDTELHKLQRWPVGNSPLGALLDPGKDVGRYGSVVPGFDTHSLDIQVRDRSHPEYGIITLVFDRKAGAPGGLELAGWITLDAQSRRTVIRLSGQRYGVPVADGLFRVTHPMAGPHH